MKDSKNKTIKYSAKTLEKIDELPFNQITFSTLNPEDVLVARVEVGNKDMESQMLLFRKLKETLSKYGVDKVLFIPVKNGRATVEFQKIKKD